MNDLFIYLFIYLARVEYAEQKYVLHFDVIIEIVCAGCGQDSRKLEKISGEQYMDRKVKNV